MSSLFHDDKHPLKGTASEDQCVMLATTAYDNPDASYTYSIQRSREALHQAGIASEYMLLSGNCHVDDARNRVVHEFLAGGCTDLVFIDADVSWDAADLVKLCQYDVDLVGGVYPFRRDTPQSKDNMPVQMIPGVVEPDSDGLIRVAGLPTGFIKIRRHVLETLARDANRYWNKGDRRAEIPILFERSFENGTRWGGDLNFCRKWHGAGGKIYAASEMTLGHTAKAIIRDSLGAALRRQGEETLRYIADQIKAGSTDINLFKEARRYDDNEWGALEDVLVLCAVMGRMADGPIIETGSGLTTIILAAASGQPVYCLEHDPIWAMKLERMAYQAGLTNIGLCQCPIKDGWYDLTDFPDLPDRFALGLNDGPPRALGDRIGFYERFGNITDVIIADDADDRRYGDAIEEWCSNNDHRVDFIEGRAALIRRLEPQQEEEKRYANV